MIEVLIAGDFCPQNRVCDRINEGDLNIFDDVQSIIEGVDYSIVNLECPIAEEGYTPITKQGPCLKSSESAIALLKKSGFCCTTLANNHFRDFGDDGCGKTIEFIKQYNIDYVGGGTDIIEAQRVLVKKNNGVSVAVLNVCEHEYSIATTKRAGSNPLDLIWLTKSILEYKTICDFVLVIVHGGHEYYQLPSPRMKNLYRYLIDIGADAIVNHHQHCYSGYEFYNGKPIFYGLGNFCFDGNRCHGKKMWHEGYMVSLKMEKNLEQKNISFSLYPYIQCKDSPVIKQMTDKEKQRFNKTLLELNAIILDDKKLETSYSAWCSSKFDDFELSLTPYTNRLLIGLWRRKMLPSFLPVTRILNILNKIECESHRDVFLKFLKHKI